MYISIVHFWCARRFGDIHACN